VSFTLPRVGETRGWRRRGRGAAGCGGLWALALCRIGSLQFGDIDTVFIGVTEGIFEGEFLRRREPCRTDVADVD
jgi:hypothetical protein